jgi:hypothetical protein
MTTNKHFNSYKEGLDLKLLQEYCMEWGETLEEAGKSAQWVAFVERGCFKYMVHNDENGKDYCTGFAFESKFVSDFLYYLDGDVSEVSIEVVMFSELHIFGGARATVLHTTMMERWIRKTLKICSRWSMLNN